MYVLKSLVWFLATAVLASAAHGHGLSFLINAVNNKFTVTGGISDPNGFAPMVFADGSAAAQLQHVSEAGGNVARTDQPGFIIEGLAPHSAISVDFIPRPVLGTNPVQQRLLWHWSAATQSVSTVPNDLSLTVAGSTTFDQTVLSQPGSQPFPLFAVHLPPEEMGVHLHYLNYILDDSPAAPSGAYGFFARFIGPPYIESDPFLVVLNNGLDENSLRTAALAINAAASDRVTLVGDYNGNGAVDAADYVVWRDTLGSKSERAADGNNDKMIDSADYAIWRTNFGRTSTGSGSLVAVAAIPEPASWGLVFAVILSAFTARHRPFRRRTEFN
jgi:hypothetical protein